MANLKCEDCCYYAESPEVKYMHCCFREWGHEDYEIAPCDEEDYSWDEYREEEMYEEEQ